MKYANFPNPISIFLTGPQLLSIPHLQMILVTICTSPFMPCPWHCSYRNALGKMSWWFACSIGNILPFQLRYGVQQRSVQKGKAYVYNTNIDLQKKKSTHARRSFYSGHTSNVFTSAVFLSTIFSEYHPESKLRAAVWGVSLTAAATVGYLCYKAGEHYPTDILTGAMMGSVAGYLVPYMHKRKRKVGVFLSPDTQSEGMQITFSYAF